MAYGMEERANSPSIGWTRIATGLVQGALLWALTEAADNKVWPATSGPLFGVLAAIALFTPFVILAGVAEMRRRNIAIWALAVAVVVALLGLHDLTRRASFEVVEWLTPQMMVFTAAGLFIAHHLLEAGDLDDRLIARFPTYFDLAWKHGVQLVMALGFVGVFWIVLMLGGALFKLIGVNFVEDLIRKGWFAIPASTTMFAAAVQLTDVRQGLIRGIRTVALTLLSWLLPVLVFLSGAFMATLPFTGLDVLWKTRSAAAILLSASAIMIILINAAYQDGAPDTPTPWLLRWAARIGGVLLIPLVGVAAYAIGLRIGQYGLTPDRIIAAACVLAGAVYAVGYGLAAVLPGMWMKALELTNVIGAFVTLALLLALFSPIADPARLSVNDQMARLAAGRITPARVDYSFLRFHGEVYGMAALDRLVAQGGEAGRLAKAARAETREYEAPTRLTDATPASRRRNITVEPGGQVLPAAFYDQAWTARDAMAIPSCLTTLDRDMCTAFTVDLNDDGKVEVVVDQGAMTVFGVGADGRWARIGALSPNDCPSRLQGLKDGQITSAPPLWRDLVIAGARYRLDEPSCAGGPAGKG